MGDHQNPQTPQPHDTAPSPLRSPPPPPPPTVEVRTNGQKQQHHQGGRVAYPNPPDATNPDAATLREQWRFAIRQYSRWYSHAWGTAILAGLSFFALGWVIKGSNPIPSFRSTPSPDDNPRNDDAPRR